MTRIVALRQKNLSAVTVNTCVRQVKAFYLWQDTDFKLKPLKDGQTIIPTLSREQLARIINWKPVKRGELRIYAVVLTALDTGLRVGV